MGEDLLRWGEDPAAGGLLGAQRTAQLTLQQTQMRSTLSAGLWNERGRRSQQWLLLASRRDHSRLLAL